MNIPNEQDIKSRTVVFEIKFLTQYAPVVFNYIPRTEQLSLAEDINMARTIVYSTFLHVPSCKPNRENQTIIFRGN